MNNATLSKISEYHNKRDRLKTLIDQASGRQEELEKQLATELGKLSALGLTYESAPDKLIELESQISSLCANLDAAFQSINVTIGVNI